MDVSMGLTFEWDKRKAASNLRRHNVSFEEAATAFADDFSLTINDPAHSEEEERLVLIGTTAMFRIVIVVHTERGDNIRIISARRATKTEIKQYEQR